MFRTTADFKAREFVLAVVKAARSVLTASSS